MAVSVTLNMARSLALLVLSIALWTAISGDEVETKADNMANAIAQQNKKVEEQSEAMERAIDDKGKLVDAKEEEDKFEKASEKVDAVGDAADKKFEQKVNLVDKLADDTNTAIENQAKKVEALGNRADENEERASNLVDKIGNKIEKKTKDPESKMKPKSRMSISYTVRVPHEVPPYEMADRAEYENEIKSNKEEEKTYPWPLRQELHGYIPDFHHNPDEGGSDLSLKPFKTDNAAVEHDALSNEGFMETPSLRHHLEKMFYMPRRPTELPDSRSLPPRPPLPPRQFLSHHKRFGRRRHRFKEYDPRLEKGGLVQPTSKSSDLGLLVLPSGGPNRLSEDVRNQLEDDELLRKAAKQAFNNDEDMDITQELRKSAAEDNMERQWMKINAIGSPELLLHWPRTSKKLGAIGQQQVSVVSPGEVDLLQTEYPDYPKPKAMGTNVPGIIRSRISGKRKETTLKKLKQ